MLKGVPHLDEVLGDDSGVTGIRIKARRTATGHRAQGCFIAIGHAPPNTEIFQGQLELDNGYIVTQGGLKALPPRPACPVCLPQATCKTTCTAKTITSAGTGCVIPHSMRKALPGTTGLIEKQAAGYNRRLC